MDRKIVKWVIVGYMVLLTLTTVTPLVSAEKSVEKVNWEDVGMEIGTNDKGILSDLSGEKLQPLWKPTPEKGHWNMTEVAAKKVGWIPDKYIGTLCKYSGDADYCPDYFDPVYIFETLDWDNSQQCKHAYFVDPFDRVLKSRADEMCQHYYDLAMTEFKNGDPEEAFEYLGYAIHFLQDVGNPMHTALAPMRNIALHTTYENYVDDNWNKFYPDAQMANSWFSFTPSDSVVALATSSNKKVGTLMSDVAIGYYTRVDEIQNSNISNGLKNSLISKLENARTKVTQENYNAADNIMNAFQNELEAQRGKGISEEQYQSWYSQSVDIRYVLQWMMGH